MADNESVASDDYLEDVESIDDESIDETVAEEEDEDIESEDMKQYTQEELILPKDKIRTSEILTRFEATELISIRAQMLAQEERPLIEGKFDNPIDMAKAELKAKRCPLILRRAFDEYDRVTKTVKHYIEVWDVNEMILPDIY